MVIAELPGAREEDIEIEIEDDRLKLSAKSKAFFYDKEIALPPNSEAICKSYKNGILQIKLAKRGGDYAT